MQDDCITVKLRLQGLIVLAVNERPTWIEVVARYEDEEAICPRCGRSTWQIHQWHLQRKRDARLWGKEVWLAVLKRRFRRRRCRKVFMEPDVACGWGRRTTRRLRETVARRAREATVRSVAREEGVSDGLVERSWLEAYSIVSAPSRPHVLLGLDGFCVRRAGRMWTGMWDLQSGKAVAVVPGERQAVGLELLEALSADPPLARAWGLKEALRGVYGKKGREEAAAALTSWIKEAEGSGLPSFRRAATTLKRWQKEVLSYWRHPITNALVEGKHNRIKVLKRRAYGYRNDRSFLLRNLNLIHTD